MRTLITPLVHALRVLAGWFVDRLPAPRAELRAVAKLAAENGVLVDELAEMAGEHATLIGMLRCWHLARGDGDPCKAPGTDAADDEWVDDVVRTLSAAMNTWAARHGSTAPAGPRTARGHLRLVGDVQ